MKIRVLLNQPTWAVASAFQNATIELAEAIDIAGGYDERIIVEQAVEGATEVNCAVLGNADYQTISSLEYPKSWSSFLSVDEKYIARKEASEKKEVKPKKLSSKVEKQIQEI